MQELTENSRANIQFLQEKTDAMKKNIDELTSMNFDLHKQIEIKDIVLLFRVLKI